MSLIAAMVASLGGEPIIDVQAGTYYGLPGTGVSYSLQSDGEVHASTGLITHKGDWITPKSRAPGNYEVRATLSSGALSAGSTGTWLPLTTTRTWSVTVVGSATLTIEIRDGSGTVKATGSVVLQGGGEIGL